MNIIKLSPALNIAFELRHSKVSDGNERDRIKADLLRSEGNHIDDCSSFANS